MTTTLGDDDGDREWDWDWERESQSQSQEGKEIHLILHKSNDIILQK